MTVHPHTDEHCTTCGSPDGKCTGNQCTASVELLGDQPLYCHDDKHDGDRHHMQQLERYDVEADDVGVKYRAARIVDVWWEISDKTLGDILAEDDTETTKTESEATS